MRKFNITVNGTTYHVEVEEVKEFGVSAPVVASPIAVVAPPAPKAPTVATVAPAAVSAGDTGVPSPMPGKIAKVVAKDGSTVKKGDVLLVLEAMKMQNEITSPVDGTIKSVNVTTGQNVKPGEVLVVIK